jgi:MoaA/NifB/PqqE/SkfB family radical SAM enzyme
MLNTNWINKEEANITIKLNDLCNTKCLHCFSHGKDRSFLDVENNINNFSILWNELYNKGICRYDIAFVGGEITLLPINTIDLILRSFYQSIYNFLSLLSTTQKKIKLSFSISFITNFIFDLNGSNYLNYLLQLNKNPTFDLEFNKFEHIANLEFNVVTSYDIGLERFKSKNIYQSWLKNCSKFDAPLHLLITLNKETCINIERILNDNFFHKFSMICFQPMLNFSDKDELLPSYDELYKTYHLINNYKTQFDRPYVMGWSAKPGYHISINNDGILSCSVSEEVKLYENKDYFNISQILDRKELFSNMLDEQFKFRIKRTRNRTCLSCEFFEDCDFGLELFTQKVICPAFKIRPE